MITVLLSTQVNLLPTVSTATVPLNTKTAQPMRASGAMIATTAKELSKTRNLSSRVNLNTDYQMAICIVKRKRVCIYTRVNLNKGYITAKPKKVGQNKISHIRDNLLRGRGMGGELVEKKGWIQRKGLMNNGKCGKTVLE